MAVNVAPYFKAVLILQGLFTAYLVLATILFMNTPRVSFNCHYRLSEYSRPYVPWEPTAVFSICAILFATFVTYAGAAGYKDESAATLRHIKIAIIGEAIFGFWAINDLSRAIARFEGYVNGLGWNESGCPALEKNVFFIHSALFCLFFFKVPFLLLLDSYLKSLGDDFIFFDYIMTIVSWIRNCIKYGRQRISFTSSYVRSQVQTRFGKAIRVSQKNDTLFREVEIGSRMFGAITLELLKENIAHKYDRHPNEIIRLTKNGNVLIIDDADVNRIGNEDHIEVEFEDVGMRLREVDSVMLEDSISETRINV